MATITNIEELQIWQLAREQSKNIYTITRYESFKSDYRFVQQIRAAAGSVMDNIAEGFAREGNKEFVQYLYVARGSCTEVLSQLYRAFDAGYITQEEQERLIQSTKKLNSMIYNLIVKLKSSNYTGAKFKQP